MKKLLPWALAGLIVLCWSDSALLQTSRITENLRHETVVVPLATPEKARMAQVDSRLFIEVGGANGVFFFYDDPATKVPIDYIEFYDLEGHLLLISWIDRFGVCQAAMDSGLLDAKNPRVDRSMVAVALGTGL